MTTVFTTALTIILSTLATSVAKAEDQDGPVSRANTVEVWGTRTESTRAARAGQSVMIRPDDETRFDTRVHLRNEPNLALPDTGRINASGFNLPRVRGQDSRFTEVYLDGLRVQDPYVGFPFIDDLDLRACGELSIYVGNPPPSLPTINPNGAIAYRMFTPVGRKDQTGILVGRPYGTALWALSRYRSANGSDARFYGREHWTDGRFPYHDDNATPYNVSDDRTGERRHADRRAIQFLPTFNWQSGGHHVSVLGLWNDAKTSLPARNSSTNSLAREYSRHRVGRIAYNFKPESSHVAVPELMGLEIGRYDDQMDVSDPTNVVLGSVQSNKRRLLSSSAATNLKWTVASDQGESSLYLRGEATDTSIRAMTSAATDYTIRRRQSLFYSGLDLAILPTVRAELKGMITRQTDNANGKKNQETVKSLSQSRHLMIPGSSLGLAWQPQDLTVYMQVARVRRSPTLLEQFGDGALIRDNPGLSPETTIHRELGIQWRVEGGALITGPMKQFSLRSSLFRDDTWDRIILLPSIAQTMRAQNAVRTAINGAEIAGEITAWSTTLMAGYARLFPMDLSYSSRHRTVPGVAEHVATGSISQNLGLATLRWQSRYQSQVWRDSENSIAVPGYLIHDATLDAKWSQFSFGFGLFNLTDQRRLNIYADGTEANRGATSYSDYAGMPLPGRHWRVSVSASL
ncbi:MAG: TonB-dependent receptor [Deltaproteobacteria bacterium]|nr:TonB-dependent receptor [Deltaproteobacteria bacterium]